MFSTPRGVVDDMRTHLFRYNYDGKVWQFEIRAHDEQDAKDRLARLAFASYMGVRVATIPVVLSPIAPVAVWLRNAAVALVARFAAHR
jgi:hypothetical protein